MMVSRGGAQRREGGGGGGGRRTGRAHEREGIRRCCQRRPNDETRASEGAGDEWRRDETRGSVPFVVRSTVVCVDGVHDHDHDHGHDHTVGGVESRRPEGREGLEVKRANESERLQDGRAGRAEWLDGGFSPSSTVVLVVVVMMSPIFFPFGPFCAFSSLSDSCFGPWRH